ncbi:4-hydroxybenzoate polyprenyltransferase [Candidatus Magnetomoraceae bacterium gMMP-15]
MIERIAIFGRMIKFSHTIFALPFALSAVILAQSKTNITFNNLWWILLAMVGARSAAMGFNRIVDVRFDTKNPRTAKREIPSGSLSIQTAIIFVIIFSGIFIFASAMLGNLCLYFSIPVLIILFFYSYAKRFTCFTHIYLGFSISLAPIGAWIAMTGSFSWPITLLSLALLTHIAGFDILYSCQDVEFDKKQGLFSIPARFGVKKALMISSFIHLLSFIFFISILVAFNMGILYFIAAIIIGWLLIWEHKLVDPSDLSKVNVAFFNINSIISVVLFAGVLGDELIKWWF